MQQRQQTLGEIAARLKFLAESFGVAVVATNHVVTAHSHLQSRSSFGAPFSRAVTHSLANAVTPGCSGGGLLDLFDDDDDPAAVALGNTWSHCVNTRFVIAATSRFDQLPGADNVEDHETRDKPVVLSVHKSPLLGSVFLLTDVCDLWLFVVCRLAFTVPFGFVLLWTGRALSPAQLEFVGLVDVASLNGFEDARTAELVWRSMRACRKL